MLWSLAQGYPHFQEVATGHGKWPQALESFQSNAILRTALLPSPQVLPRIWKTLGYRMLIDLILVWEVQSWNITETTTALVQLGNSWVSQSLHIKSWAVPSIKQ